MQNTGYSLSLVSSGRKSRGVFLSKTSDLNQVVMVYETNLANLTTASHWQHSCSSQHLSGITNWIPKSEKYGKTIDIIIKAGSHDHTHTCTLTFTSRSCVAVVFQKVIFDLSFFVFQFETLISSQNFGHPQDVTELSSLTSTNIIYTTKTKIR